jgi:F-type H+-transporting ATPase subunit a
MADSAFLLSPLEQFEILIVKPLTVFGFDITITNSSLYLFLTLFVCFLFFYLSSTPTPLVIPNRWQYLLEQTYLFVLDMVKQQAGFKALPYFPALLAVFLFIAVSNLLGLTPFGFTSTSHIIVTFLFAFSFNLGILFLGLQLHKLHFFSLFVPSGVPKVLLPLIVVIEVISYLIRTFSLSLRLFANMDGWSHVAANTFFFCCCFLVDGKHLCNVFSSSFNSCFCCRGSRSGHCVATGLCVHYLVGHLSK